MPTINIVGADGLLCRDFMPRVVATMVYPGGTDGHLRDQFVARVLADCMVNRGVAATADERLQKDIFRLALEADHHPLAARGDPRPWDAGMLAGEQLAWLFSLANAKVNGASLKKARYLVEYRLSDEGLPGANKYLADNWRSHGAVAHFWAAYILRDETFQRFEYLGEDVPPFPGELDCIRFLWEAEQIRRFAVSYAPNGKARLFGGSIEMWTLPPNMPSLPWHPGWPPLRVSTFALTPKIEKRLAQYRDGPPPKKLGRPRKGCGR